MVTVYYERDHGPVLVKEPLHQIAPLRVLVDLVEDNPVLIRRQSGGKDLVTVC